MALFPSKEKGENPDAKKESASSSASAKQETVRKMSGYDSIGAVRSAAPESTGGESFNIRQPAKSSRTAQAQQINREEIAATEKEKMRLQALETVGKEMMRKLASIPYESWAMLADDEYYKLKPEQAKELADSYYVLAQSTKVDFSNPWIMAIGIASLHAVLVADRLRYANRSDEVKAMEELHKEAAKPN